MSMDPNRWLNTVPFIGTKSNQEKYKLDYNRWINTLPRKDDNILTLSNEISTNSNSNSGKKYYLTIVIFVVGLILVSVIKNETRNLQREISNLQASINAFKFDLHQATLEHEVITSPENISRLAKEHLESDFVFYKRSQIKQLSGELETLGKVTEKKDKKTFVEKSKKKTNEMKLKFTKKIEITKTELRKLQDLYSAPEELPKEIRIQIAKKIEIKKNELKNLSSDPYGLIKSKKMRNWAGLQVVKIFLGIPIVPGR